MKNAIIMLAVVCLTATCSPTQACGLFGRKCAPGRASGSCHRHTNNCQQPENSLGKAGAEAKVLVFQVYKDSLGEWRWHLKAGNNRIIADSGEGYENKSDCLHAIDLIRSGAAGAVVR